MTITFITLPALSIVLSTALATPKLPASLVQVAQGQRKFVDHFSGLGLGQLDPIDRNKWDIAVHTRSPEFWFQLDPMEAAHGFDTASPPATHLISAYEDAVYVAREHLMTAINAVSYGLVFWWVDTEIDDLGFNSGVVQFGHHSYNPMKEGTTAPIAHETQLAGTANPSPNSWHWDAFLIEPAIPFQSIPADRRYVLGSDIQPVTSDRPAPKDAFLRFAAHSSTEISFDGGPFVTATRQDGSRELFSGHDDRYFSSYWMPIPEGTTNVRVQMTSEGIWDQYNLDTMAKDFSIWNLPEVQTVPGSGPIRSGPVQHLPR
jgi:hypothetical protein